MKIFKYLKSLIINLKFRIGWPVIYNNKWGKVVYIHQLKNYIVFCPHCGEYICDDGLCSNPICPEIINDYNYQKVKNEN